MRKFFAWILMMAILGGAVTVSAAPYIAVGTEKVQIAAVDEAGTLIMVNGEMVYLPRASKQLDSYSINLTDKGDGTLKVYYAVYGTHDGMACVGAQKVVIEEEVSPSVWVEYKSFNSLYDYDVLYCSDAFEVSVIPGGKYRAVLTAYARDSSGADTGTVTSKTVVAT